MLPNPNPKRQDIQKFIKGCLEVQAVVNTKMGISETYIPQDTIGYVVNASKGKFTIVWPTLIESKSCRRPLLGSHNSSDVKPTGKRG